MPLCILVVAIQLVPVFCRRYLQLEDRDWTRSTDQHEVESTPLADVLLHFDVANRFLEAKKLSQWFWVPRSQVTHKRGDVYFVMKNSLQEYC